MKNIEIAMTKRIKSLEEGLERFIQSQKSEIERTSKIGKLFETVQKNFTEALEKSLGEFTVDDATGDYHVSNPEMKYWLSVHAVFDTDVETEEITYDWDGEEERDINPHTSGITITVYPFHQLSQYCGNGIPFEFEYVGPNKFR